ncbi:uncharacterized protein LOC106166188 [Lingula anatina]|uniref:Uncharacterized protein LOC106166188 n=1 Tax=Lingula anatina TaxID=7574 RepID=A0A1S3IQC8_LINAN|nr:uncharacterized protein LOC106166188 [Lingula anatina]|eukprot:XP_013400116.1 uncharacterized protein LOC106166188 [Lingula anatina]
MMKMLLFVACLSLLISSGKTSKRQVDCKPGVPLYRSVFEPDRFTMVSDEGGQEIALGPRAETWTYTTDFDDDCDIDILAGNGGYVYLLENTGDSSNGRFAAPRKLTTADGTVIDKGYWSGSPVFKDMNGDGLKDLLLSEWAGDLTLISLFINTGTSKQPTFSAPKVLINNNAGGVRFDAADWNNDGLNDLVVGPDRQPFAYYPNEGTASSPIFSSSATNIQDGYTTITQHYPRVVDWRGDGKEYILYSGYYPSSGVHIWTKDPKTGKEEDAVLLGSDAQIGNKVGYRLSSNMADFNGDGLTDLLISGKLAKLVIFWGKDINQVTQHHVDGIAAILSQHITDLGSVMESNDQVCEKLQLHQDALLKIANLPMPESFKEYFFNTLAALVQKYPQYLSRQRFSSTYLAHFSFYTWIIMLEGRDDTRSNRLGLAEVSNHTGSLKDVLVERGVMLIDNDQSSELANRLLRDYVLSLRTEYFWIERISKQCALSGIDGSRYTYRQVRKGGVNVFCNDEHSSTRKHILPGCKVCKTHGNPVGNGLVSVVAHEIGHNFVEYPGVNAKRFLLMKRALQGSPDIFWQDNNRYDSTKTQEHFASKGWFNPGSDNWNSILHAYFNGQFIPEAAQYQYQIITNANPGYVGLTHPQEFFASIAQCFSMDSKMLMDIAVERFLSTPSYKESINQILFLVEYYSLGGGTSRFWMHTHSGNIYYYEVTLERNPKDHIVAVSVPKDVARKVDNPNEAYLVDLPSPHVYRFQVDGDGFVTAIEEYPAYINP